MKVVLLPFTIKAIGPTDLFYGSLMMPGGYIYYMEEDGIIVEKKRMESVTIEKYNGVINPKYIKSKR